ncbi:hypothetical protein FSP39_002089 [Pinctada imbricata]|uniref:PNPLA domain-containing protein n=1 Tax=Pinctada imbricata TaxID=66713 RepID=A0AA88YLN3_PINIB|nr:hypothetical protein FSP39_002089 [Pinctada imbricata]
MSAFRTTQGCSNLFENSLIRCIPRHQVPRSDKNHLEKLSDGQIAVHRYYSQDFGKNGHSGEIEENDKSNNGSVKSFMKPWQENAKRMTAGILSKIELSDIKNYVPSTSDVKDKVSDLSDSIKTSMEVANKKRMLKKREKEKELERQALVAEKHRTFIEQMEDTSRSILEAYDSAPEVVKQGKNLTSNAVDIPAKTDGKPWGFNKFSWFADPRFQFKATRQEAGELTKKEVKKVVNKEYISKEDLERRTKELVYLQKKAVSNSSRRTRAQKLCDHLLLYPDTRQYAKSNGGQATLLKLLDEARNDKALEQELMKALALIGYCPPPRGEGINILAIDGGGTKGLVALKSLRELERRCGKPLYLVFDYVCGVSTGSLILAIVFLFKRSISECEELYIEKSKQMFTQSRVRGSIGLAKDASFYNTELWQSILRDLMKEKTMIDFSRDQECPKFSAISSISNLAKPKNYMFRNYNLPPGVFSNYPGSCKHKMWECIRASSAAPGFYKPFVIDDFLHQDGGVLTNNPTAIAIHESKLLWPREKIQCIVSLGNGRYEPDLEIISTDLSTRQQLSNLIESSSDTEAVHLLVQDMLPLNTYYRFNPYISEDILLNEIRMEKLNHLQQDTILYLRRNSQKLDNACAQLLRRRSTTQGAVDSINLFLDKEPLARLNDTLKPYRRPIRDFFASKSVQRLSSK